MGEGVGFCANMAEEELMAIKTSSSLHVGEVYSRNKLKELFQIGDATINNGIFRPKDHDSVWLFVTEEKQDDRTQYTDRLVGDTLTIQGQTQGRTDALIREHKAQGLELLLFHRKKKDAFSEYGFRYEGEFLYASEVGEKPTTFTLSRATAKRFRNGEIPNWQIVLNAVEKLGGAVTMSQIRETVLEKYPDFAAGNFNPDVSTLCVNSASRGHYGVNFKPRRTDSGNQYDRLYQNGKGDTSLYELYDPLRHGVWELYDAGDGERLKVRRIEGPTDRELSEAETEATNEHAFDPNNQEDARHRTVATIVRRRGQPAFRRNLLEEYDGKCAITGCSVVALLEAAHISPYKGEKTNVIENGLLLRADIHTLFDLQLLCIEPVGLTVCLHPDLHNSEYAHLQGVRIRQAKNAAGGPSLEALKAHSTLCDWMG
jgi:hypothetical protein